MVLIRLKFIKNDKSMRRKPETKEGGGPFVDFIAPSSILSSWKEPKSTQPKFSFIYENFKSKGFIKTIPKAPSK